jgi:hypothetical protein
MKASLVAYDFRKLQKVRAKNSKIWVCQRLTKIASDPSVVKIGSQMAIAFGSSC